MSVMSDKNVPGASADEPMEDTPPLQIGPMEDIYMEDTDMLDVAENIEIPPFLMSLPEPHPLKPTEEKPQPGIHNHAPDNYYYFCWCDDCRRFYGTGKPTQCVDPRTLEIPPRPRYGYMGFLNSMRAASARREEERNKRLAEGEQAAGEKSPKKSKATKSPNKKNLRQTIKRRRV